MTGVLDHPARQSRPFGYSDDELAALPTVFRGDLLAGRVFLVSGGGSGIGRATAFLLARLGAQVMICGRREALLREAAASMARLTGQRVAFRAMTIRDAEQAAEVIAECHRSFGRLDALVNNAGGQFSQNAIDITRNGWTAVVDTNLNGTWHMMQAAARRWIATDAPGNIVNVVRVVERGVPQASHSCAARAGVIGLTRSVAVEWAPHRIRVNCVAPGPIESDGLEHHSPPAVAQLRRSNPMKRLGSVWDIAESIVYLSARSGEFVTGSVMTVDGGMQLWGEMWMAGKPRYFEDQEDDET